jgi:hypothetical protein
MVTVIGLAAATPTVRASDTLSGNWQGDYVCAQGATGLTLAIQPGSADRVDAIFRFYALPTNPVVPDGCFEMSGSVASDKGVLSLTAGRWLLHPSGYVTVNLSGTIGSDSGSIGGRVFGPGCATFSVHRVSGDVSGVPVPCRSPDVVASSSR